MTLDEFALEMQNTVAEQVAQREAHAAYVSSNLNFNAGNVAIIKGLFDRYKTLVQSLGFGSELLQADGNVFFSMTRPDNTGNAFTIIASDLGVMKIEVGRFGPVRTITPENWPARTSTKVIDNYDASNFLLDDLERHLQAFVREVVEATPTPRRT